ncbi:MAG: transposase [Burkholderiales bacterium]
MSASRRFEDDMEPMAARADPLRASARRQVLHPFVAQADGSDREMLRGVAQRVVPRMNASAEAFWIVDDTGATCPRTGPMIPSGGARPGADGSEQVDRPRVDRRLTDGLARQPLEALIEVGVERAQHGLHGGDVRAVSERFRQAAEGFLDRRIATADVFDQLSRDVLELQRNDARVDVFADALGDLGDVLRFLDDAVVEVAHLLPDRGHRLTGPFHGVEVGTRNRIHGFIHLRDRDLHPCRLLADAVAERLHPLHQGAHLEVESAGSLRDAGVRGGAQRRLHGREVTFQRTLAGVVQLRERLFELIQDAAELVRDLAARVVHGAEQAHELADDVVGLARQALDADRLLLVLGAFDGLDQFVHEVAQDLLLAHRLGLQSREGAREILGGAVDDAADLTQIVVEGLELVLHAVADGGGRQDHEARHLVREGRRRCGLAGGGGLTRHGAPPVEH